MQVDIEEVTLRIAVSHVIEGAGHRVVGPDDDHELVVTDDPLTEARPISTVLVVAPVAAPCQAALHAVLDGRARSVLCADDPERLPTALDAVADGWTTVDRRAVDIAGEAPRLDDRRAFVLQLILRGNTNQQLAASMRQSVSTVKRDISELFHAFGASSRLELAANARARGVRAELGTHG